jgi:signal transduction histidine kinase
LSRTKLPFQGDFEALPQLVGNLSSNAMQYSPEEAKLTLKLKIEAERYLLSVAHEGNVWVESVRVREALFMSALTPHSNSRRR